MKNKYAHVEEKKYLQIKKKQKNTHIHADKKRHAEKKEDTCIRKKNARAYENTTNRQKKKHMPAKQNTRV